MSSFPSKSLQTLSGTITAWLPLPTPYPSIAACSSQIYQQRAGLGSNFIAFDPLFGQSILPSGVTCLPPEVTSSWYQSYGDTTTVLGPTIFCPGAYSAIQTILVNPTMQQVLCCPSSYTINSALFTGKARFPSQCISHLTLGQTLSYQSTTPSGPWGSQVTTVQSCTTSWPSVVFEMHVNGFNVLSSHTAVAANASDSGTSSSSPPNFTSIATSPSSVTSLEGNPLGKSGLSRGATAGIAIGVLVMLVGVVIGGWLVFKRRRKGSEVAEREYYKPVVHTGGVHEAIESGKKDMTLHELPTVENSPVEIGGS